jgi:hypothetical protein
MNKSLFNQEMVNDLREILESRSIGKRRDCGSGRYIEEVFPFSGDWELVSVWWSPGDDQGRIECLFRRGGEEVTAVIRAKDFSGKKSRSGRSARSSKHNTPRDAGSYDQWAVLFSILIQEQVITQDFSSLPSGEVLIRLPGDRGSV